MKGLVASSYFEELPELKVLVMPVFAVVMVIAFGKRRIQLQVHQLLFKKRPEEHIQAKANKEKRFQNRTFGLIKELNFAFMVDRLFCACYDVSVLILIIH
ncbi:hypothetical protein BLD48_06975 [Exiguobacterium sp. KRL4]|uniref:hypothetical protein n=1 Tax=Exiguobacterium sp. KRL4 TaxID=1914536 RepID=UPI0008F847EE|nr:hypothetical protein [Exiguobacterium sp. KRL4]OIN67360.1 hypothetical protein BLD48_06975 [Exiguobacterium sp. KRL4]